LRLTVTESSDQVYLVALRLLAGRDYTRAALTRKLEQRGYATELIDAVVARLAAENFLNDRRYAVRLIDQSRENGRYVGYRLRQELQRRGVPATLLDELLAEHIDADEETALARQLVARRYARFDPALSDEGERRRVAGFLQRRGFRLTTIWSLLKDHHDR